MESNQNGASENKSRAALQSFMTHRGLKAHPWARAANLRSSTLYNFLSGRSHSLTAESLNRLAHAAGTTVDQLLGNESHPTELQAPTKKATPVHTTSGGNVALKWLVGVYGKLFQMERETILVRPIGLPDGVEAVAARIDGDGLHPIPSDWIVIFEAKPRTPEDAIGKLCVVRMRGSQQPMIRELRRGPTPGLYTLLSWGASPLEGVEVVEAHLVLSITQWTE